MKRHPPAQLSTEGDGPLTAAVGRRRSNSNSFNRRAQAYQAATADADSRSSASASAPEMPETSASAAPAPRTRNHPTTHASPAPRDAWRAAPAPPASGPLQLVRMTDSGKLEVGPEAAAALRAVRTPIGVVSVCGRARTGKSYLLNQLLGQAAGFTLGHNYKPCTKGLWMWSVPIRRTGPDGGDYHLVLLDTEGIDAYNQTTQDAVQIFSLAVLLSSLFVFNQMGPIDEAALDRLSLVTEITKHIRVRANTSREDERELGELSPSFLWLLRDFYFELEDEGRRVSAREYLETALMPSSGGAAAVEAKNAIRSSIKSLFPDRDCFTLVRPCVDERQLNHLDRLPKEELRPEFAEGIDRLTALIFSRASPKRIGSNVVNGPMLAGLAEAYVAAINAGGVPTISTAWQGVAEAECRRAAAAAEDAYRSTFDEASTAPEPEALTAEHQKAMAAAKAAFKQVAVGEPRLRAGFKAAYRASCESRFEMTRDRLLSRAQAEVEVLLSKTAQHVSTAARLHGTIPQLRADFSSAAADFLSHARGPTRWPRLVEFLQQQWPDAADEVVRRVEDAATERARAAEGRISDLSSKLQAAEARAQQAEQRAKDLADAEGMVRGQLMRERQRKSSQAGSWLGCLKPSAD